MINKTEIIDFLKSNAKFGIIDGRIFIVNRDRNEIYDFNSEREELIRFDSNWNGKEFEYKITDKEALDISLDEYLTRKYNLAEREAERTPRGMAEFEHIAVLFEQYKNGLISAAKYMYKSRLC